MATDSERKAAALERYQTAQIRAEEVKTAATEKPLPPRRLPALSPNERRLAIVYVGEEEILDAVISHWKDFPQAMSVLKTNRGLNFPSDTRIVSVYHEWNRRAFVFVLRSRTFETVEPGSKLPVLGNAMLDTREWLVRQEDGSYRPADDRP